MKDKLIYYMKWFYTHELVYVVSAVFIGLVLAVSFDQSQIEMIVLSYVLMHVGQIIAGILHNCSDTKHVVEKL